MPKRSPRSTRFLLRFLVPFVVIAMVLAACGGDDDGDDGAAPGDGGQPGATTEAPTTTEFAVDPSLCPTELPDSGGPVQIDFWHAMTERNAATLQELADRYNSSQSKVKVTLTYQGTYNETLDKYIAALRSNDLPDMVQMEETAMQIMLDSESTVPVAACVEADGYDTSDFVDPVLSQYSVGGALVTWPFQLSNPVLYYNKAAFRRAGLDPDDAPSTLDELLETSRAIVAGGGSPKAFAIQVQGWYPEQWAMMAGAAIVDNDNGRLGRATKATLDTPEFAAGFDWIEQMNAEGLLVNVGRDEGLRDGLLAVANEQAAMTINTSAALGTIYDTLPLFPNVELGVAPLPGPTGGGLTVGGGSLYMMDTSTDAEKAAVWDFLKFLATPESQATWHIGTGYIPTSKAASSRPEVTALWAERPGFKVAYDQLAGSAEPPGGGFPVIGDYVGFRNAIEAGVEAILNGTPAAEAQQRAQSGATEAIENYNKRIGA
jgi:sn-glycerol 3-phosphate transport system substrate-binding protein